MTNGMPEETLFHFEDMMRTKRPTMGTQVPLALFRAMRWIGTDEGLPADEEETASATSAHGKAIGRSLPVRTIAEFVRAFQELKLGIPTVTQLSNRGMHISVDECSCAGLPVHHGKFICDLEGLIMEGALGKIFSREAVAREVRCTVNGDDRCEYEISFLNK